MLSLLLRAYQDISLGWMRHAAGMSIGHDVPCQQGPPLYGSAPDIGRRVVGLGWYQVAAFRVGELKLAQASRC
jgi:hypothetical protein